MGEAQKDQERPPAWKAQGEHHRGWVHQQAEVQELVLVIQVWWVGLPVLFSVAWGWRWETCQGRDRSAGEVEEKRKEDYMVFSKLEKRKLFSRGNLCIRPGSHLSNHL